METNPELQLGFVPGEYNLVVRAVTKHPVDTPKGVGERLAVRLSDGADVTVWDNILVEYRGRDGSASKAQDYGRAKLASLFAAARVHPDKGVYALIGSRVRARLVENVYNGKVQPAVDGQYLP
jgi:hypothetical protein